MVFRPVPNPHRLAGRQASREDFKYGQLNEIPSDKSPLEGSGGSGVQPQPTWGVGEAG